MEWNVGNEFLRHKKRHPDDGNKNTLKKGELKKDVGFAETMATLLVLQGAEKVLTQYSEGPKPGSEGIRGEPPQK